MPHIKVTLFVKNGPEREMIMAMLAGIGYDGFEENDSQLLAYIEEQNFDNAALKPLAGAYHLSYDTELIAAQNWNALWESNFDPVIVDDFCTIRADFHDIKVDTPYEIIITPKMSFGTGHHATTQQVMMLMKGVPFAGKNVLDFGTGTGVLAILAEMLGAKHILAIDNDLWSVENAQENILRNHAKNITVQQGTLEDINPQQYDVILANINRHILLQYLPALYEQLIPGGVLIMSGILREDQNIMLNAANAQGFRLHKATEKMNWIALHFLK